MTVPTKFTDIAPIFPVSDVRTALKHYRTLGFRVAPYEDGDDYGFAERGRVHLHLTYRPTSYYPNNGIAVAYLTVHDAQTLFAAWSQPGISGHTEPLADMPWGMHEGLHTDPDGNIIRYGSPTTWTGTRVRCVGGNFAICDARHRTRNRHRPRRLTRPERSGHSPSPKLGRLPVLLTVGGLGLSEHSARGAVWLLVARNTQSPCQFMPSSHAGQIR